MDGPIDIAAGLRACCATRRSRCRTAPIDVLIKANDPDTIKHLVPVLKDENEYARRAAVEVLNEVGDAQARSSTCSPRSRTTTGGCAAAPATRSARSADRKVIDAVLELVRDKDEDIRRAAIEILNQTKDERAVDHLIEATRDKDWWVSERAVDALAEIGSKRALPRLLEMLQRRRAARLPVVVRAIGKLGDPKLVDLAARRC